MNYTTKNRKTKSIILSMTVATALTGCAVPGMKTGDETLEAPEHNIDLVIDEQENSSSAATESPAENTAEQDMISSWDDPYEVFLAGEGTLSTQYYRDNVYDDSEYRSDVDEVVKNIPADKDHTLKEFYDALGDVQSISYAFLDCGADGHKELALKVVGNFVEPESTMTFVIKEIDGKLQLVYGFAEWSRSQTTLYEYGEISGGGSSGATNHGWNVALINAEGKYVYGYYCEEESDIEQFAHLKEHDEFDASDLKGELCIYTLRLAPYGEMTENDEFYSYSVYSDGTDGTYGKMDVPDLYTNSPYKTVMDSFKDISFVTEDELDSIITDKLESIGLTGKIASGHSLEYKEIDFNKEYVHDITADYYRVPSSIQEELEIAELRSVGYENADIDNMPQQPANATSYEWYQMWDNELNDLWSRISNEIDPDKKQALVEEQRAWVKRKEANVTEAGLAFAGGTMQPLLENTIAKTFTRKRCYELAAILAEIRGEDFQVPSEVAESYKDVDLSLEEVFKKFEGQWIFNMSTGACLSIFTAEEFGEWAPEESAWVVTETGGDTISDLDVISFTDDTIVFKVPRDGYDSYYKLRFNMENDAELLYGHSIEELNEQG